MGLYGYTYLKHILHLWPGYWVNHMSKMNEEVGEKNFIDKCMGRKR